MLSMAAKAAIDYTAQQVPEEAAASGAASSSGPSEQMVMYQQNNKLAATMKALEQQLEQSAQLEGTVTFETTNGYTAFSDKIRIDLKAGRAVSPGPVRAEGPAGSITAGAMQATQSDESNVQSPEGRIEFWGGVRLIYLPSASKSAK